MKERKKRRLKKFHFHPATTFLLLTILVIVVSSFVFCQERCQIDYNLMATFEICGKCKNNTIKSEKT